jgi:D-3-phosphoglycerate dehydrogenase
MPLAELLQIKGWPYKTGRQIMKKIHCLNAIADCGTKLFPADYELTDKMEEAQGVLVRSASMHDMELGEELLAIGRAGAGVNNIPLDACAEKGIVVFNTPGANANGVKELVFAGMLLASRDIVGGIDWCRQNAGDENIAKTTEKSKKAFAGCELKGKKLGVIGLGAIGAEVANAATHFGMEVYGYDPYISVNAAWRLSRNVKHITNADTIYQECDYITIHVPALDSTKGMINKDTLAMMKDGVVILNYARDVLVKDDDMAEALETGKVSRYVTDFPNPKTANMKHVILTPHLGASTKESEDNCAVMAVKEMTDYLENGNIRNSVNYPACDMGVCQAESRVAVLHLNIPNMIGQITGILADQGVNITDMTNKSRDKYAYTLLDMEHRLQTDTLERLKAIKGVLRVRVVK